MFSTRNIDLLALGWLILSTGALSSTVARADDAPAEEDAPAGEQAPAEGGDEAQEYFDRGAEYYFQQEYGKALVEFHRAHRAHPHPVFLYNIAMSNMRLGQLEEAREAAAEARTMEPGLPPENRAGTVSIVTAVDTVDRAGRVAESVTGGGNDDVEPRSTDPEELEAPESSSSFGALGWTGVGVATAGTASLVGALITSAQIDREWDRLAFAGSEMDEDDFYRRRHNIDRMQLRGRILLFGGLGVTGLGAALIGAALLGDDPDETARTALAPAIGSPGVNLVVRW